MSDQAYSIFEILCVLSITTILWQLATLNRVSLTPNKLRSEVINRYKKLLETQILYANLHQKKIEIHATEKRLTLLGYDFLQEIKLNYPITIRSAQGNLVIYPDHLCSPAQVIITDNQKTCYLFLSLRCRVRAEC